MKNRQKRKFEVILKCKHHFFTILKKSFFEKTSFDIRSLFVFIQYYCSKNPLYICQKKAGMISKGTPDDWAGFVREIYCQQIWDWLHEQYPLSGEIQVILSSTYYKL